MVKRGEETICQHFKISLNMSNVYQTVAKYDIQNYKKSVFKLDVYAGFHSLSSFYEDKIGLFQRLITLAYLSVPISGIYFRMFRMFPSLKSIFIWLVDSVCRSNERESIYEKSRLIQCNSGSMSNFASALFGICVKKWKFVHAKCGG